MSDKNGEKQLPVVGIGASAGGLDALKRFFGAVKPGAGLAYVVVMHLDPERESRIPSILSRSADIPVIPIESGVTIEEDTGYVLPPGKEVAIEDGRLVLSEKRSETSLLTVDTFFVSLAEEMGPLAAAVLLSGTGTDGSNGAKKIKAAEGLVLVQASDSAEYSGMPRSAMATGVVDLETEPEEMPRKLVNHFFGPGTDRTAGDEREVETEAIRAVFDLLRSRTGHDFSEYKETTLRRRLNRRLALKEIDSLDSYIALLRENESEVRALFREFLIGVTHFFREPGSFAVLRDRVLPQMIRSLSRQETLRIWVPGCSTGEEAYSLAMIVRETMDDLDKSVPLHIFATDLDERAIEVARTGLYPSTIASDVREERLRRFFVPEGDFFRVGKELQNDIVFSVQNLLGDPPFSRLHVVCCRNVLIYLKPEAQRKLLPLFHYTLNPGGALVLGTAESIGGHTQLFQVVDQKQKVFRRKEVSRAVRGSIEFPTGPVRREGSGRPSAGRLVAKETETATAASTTQEFLLEHFAPTAVLVEQDGTIIHIQGRTGRFLEAGTGPATTNVVDLAREGLRLELAAALRAARNGESPAVRRGVTVRSNDDFEAIDLHVITLEAPDPLAGKLVVVFREVPRAPEPELSGESSEDEYRTDREERIAELERELQKTRQNHQSTVEELESANEELKSTNEELQSANEELQTTNEEHESSKEEFQSLNEELQTTNSELASKIEELQSAHDDIHNLFNSIDVAAIFVDKDLRVRRFTPEAKNIVNLIPSDVGRPLSDLVTKLTYGGLVEDADQVVDTADVKEEEVTTTDGIWYKMRILPYRTTDNQIDGAVLVFLGIDEQKRVQKQAEQAQLESEQAWLLVRSVFDMNPQPLAVVNEARAVIIANSAFGEVAGRRQEELEGALISDLLEAEDEEKLLSELDQAYDERGDFSVDGVRLKGAAGGRYALSGQIVRRSAELPYRILLRLETLQGE